MKKSYYFEEINKMPSYTKSTMKRLSETVEVMELWWDSSPLIFDTWVESMFEKAPQEKKEEPRNQLKVLFDNENQAGTLFYGVIDQIIKDNPVKDNYKLELKTYKAINEKGAQIYIPLFEKSNYTMG